MHLNAELLFKKYALDLIPRDALVLEIGPADIPSLHERLVEPTRAWETADIFAATTLDRSPIAHVMPDEYTIPVEDDRFDVVLSSSVLEHVRKPWRWIAEVARVCRPGGRVISIAPISWPYHGEPVDCWRIYPEGMRALHEDAGLVIELVTAETLEPQLSRRSFPGKGATQPGQRAHGMIRRLVGWPTQVSLDAIAIAQKP